MHRTDMCFLQTDSGRRIPHPQDVEFREAITESIDIPLNYMHAV
jgi:hypothetical protein